MRVALIILLCAATCGARTFTTQDLAQTPEPKPKFICDPIPAWGILPPDVDWYHAAIAAAPFALIPLVGRGGRPAPPPEVFAEPVPEPATVLLLGTSLFALAAGARRRRRHERT